MLRRRHLCVLKKLNISKISVILSLKKLPFSIFLRRVWTFPRKFTTLIVGFIANNWAHRRRDADPTTEPFGRSLIVLYFLQMNTSLVSSLSKLHGRMVPSGSQVGTSFIECTQISTEPSSKATSSSFVNKPLPPISDKAWFKILSPYIVKYHWNLSKKGGRQYIIINIREKPSSWFS